LPAPVTSHGFIWYRKHFTVSNDWTLDRGVQNNKKLYLHLGKFSGAVWIYVNGYLVNKIGKLPIADDGGSYVAVSGAKDIKAEVPTQAPTSTGGAPVAVINFGGENVIALRVYTGPNETGLESGNLMLSKPSDADYFPVDLSVENDDHLFDDNHPVALDVTYSNNTPLLSHLDFTLDVTDDLGQAPAGFKPEPAFQDIPSDKSITLVPKLTFNQPGIYNLTITNKVNDQKLPDQHVSVGYNAYKIHPDVQIPSNFDSFWKQVTSDADAKPLNVDITPDTPNGNVAVYRMTFDGIDGKPARAWVSAPATVTGKPPIIIELPGYGADFTSADTALPKVGVVVVRLLGTSPDFTSGNTAGGYMTAGIESPDTCVFKTLAGNLLRCIRVASGPLGEKIGLPNANPSIGLSGSEQGATLAVIAAALAPGRVRAFVASGPLIADTERGMKSAKAGPLTELAKYQQGGGDLNKALTTLSYFDGVTFASRVKVPGYLPIGLLDDITPPYESFAVANNIDATHTVIVLPDSGHAAQDVQDKALVWLTGQLAH
jgi:cephalosporin-C deacetylase